MKNFFLLFIACMALFATACGTQQGGSNQDTVVFLVQGDGIDCSGCANRINNAISLTRGVTDVGINMDYDLVVVTYRTNRTSVADLIAVFERINFAVEVVDLDE